LSFRFHRDKDVFICANAFSRQQFIVGAMDAMTGGVANFCRLAFLFVALTGATVAGAQTPANTPTGEIPRFLVYFDEFSANLSDEAKATIADAAKRARDTGAKGIVVQARASATGRPETNKYLAQTRSSIVTDQLEEDGIARTMIRQEPIGQTGSSDPSVYNRRVDIILER
jgi:outer membrane protein OmpA-like peptidoglycan-associated protein